MAVDDPVGTATSYIPSVDALRGFGLTAFSWITWLLILVVVLVIAFAFWFWWFMGRRYSMKFVIFKKVGGRFVPIRKDVGRHIRFSTAGDTITFLKRSKKYIPNPSLQMGNNEYWICIREDDEWINFELNDLDEEARKIGARFLEKEARYARTSIQKVLKDQFQKESFMQKYGTVVITFAFGFLLVIATWLLWDKWIELAQTTRDAIATSDLVLQKINDVLSKMDNICTGGSGIIAK